ncbi:MAG: deoxyribonuclease IV [Thermoprotei archaeon]|nr:MAG: deoxyribonuclease IV [Thermoprotei archaeon]RLF20251.1 MAG: deoxyribonuclease IV [Thermoprotei archaeon]
MPIGRTRFGPAGRPINYKGPTEKIPEYLKTQEGLDAFEYQAVRGVRISKEKAEELGNNAKEFDVLLSLHAPYAINLSSSSEETRKASIERLVLSMQAAQWMGARIVVFHPGYYGKFSKEEALELCITALKEVNERASSLGIKHVFLGPETMGKLSQVGSVEEIITMCENVPNAVPVIDWAHIHARTGGSLRRKDDYLKILDIIEKRLGSDVVSNLHCHFTKVEFTKKGERRHRRLDEEGYGPDFEILATIIVEHGYSFTIISESPVLDKDAIVMKSILERIKNTIKQT